MADRKKSEGPEYINICQNRKASFEYELEERLECGIMLRGSEVKSLRTGQANLEGAYARILKGQAEDLRYQAMRKSMGKHASLKFFAIFQAQTLFVVFFMFILHVLTRAAKKS